MRRGFSSFFLNKGSSLCYIADSLVNDCTKLGPNLKNSLVDNIGIVIARLALMTVTGNAFRGWMFSPRAKEELSPKITGRSSSAVASSMGIKLDNVGNYLLQMCPPVLEACCVAIVGCMRKFYTWCM